MKKVIITGGAGFIGSNFIRLVLAERNWQVVNVDMITYAGNPENLKDLAQNPHYTFYQADIADEKAMRKIFEKEKPDGVINFAAETHVDRSIADPDPFIRSNILGTKVLLDLSKTFGVKKYHQVSTDEVYGDLGDTTGTYFSELTPLSPNCPYAATKASADLLVASWGETYGLPVVITRCSNNYGPYQFPEKLIPFMLSKALKNEDLTLYGDGLNVRDWLHVQDHCEAILLVFEQSKIGEIWNIGGHNEKTNIEIAELIIKNVPDCTSKITFIKDRAAHDRRYAMDASKLERELGWVPKWTFEKGIGATIDWYLAHQDWLAASLADRENKN